MRFISANTPTVNAVLQMTAISHLPFHYNKSIECVSVRMFKSQVYRLGSQCGCELSRVGTTNRETRHASGINMPTKKKNKTENIRNLEMSVILLRIYVLYLLSNVPDIFNSTHGFLFSARFRAYNLFLIIMYRENL